MSLRSLFQESSVPPVAVEITAARVSAAAIDWRGGQPVVSTHASELLPPGALVPALASVNTRDRAALSTAVSRVLERMGRPRRVGLIVPDMVAKVSLVRFEQVPARAQDFEQLVRWQASKAAPFPIEDAQLSYVPGVRVPAIPDGAPAGQEVIVTLAKRDVVREYEGLCDEAGAHAGLVDLSTFNVVNAVLASSTTTGGDWLLVNVAPDSASVAIVRGSALVFFRNRSAEADGTLADLVHQTAMYYEDRLSGGGFSRVVLAGAASAVLDQTGEIDDLRQRLQDRLATSVERFDPRHAVGLSDRIAAAPQFLDTLTPLLGLLLRGRKVPA